MDWVGTGWMDWVGGVWWGSVGLDRVGPGWMGRWGSVGSGWVGWIRFAELGLVGLGWVEWIGLGLRGRAYRLPFVSARESTTSSIRRWDATLSFHPSATPPNSAARDKQAYANPRPTFPFHGTPTEATPFTAFSPHSALFSRPTNSAKADTKCERWDLNKMRKKTTKRRQHFGTLACTRPRSCWRIRRCGNQSTGDYISPDVGSPFWPVG